jgi:acyl-CoA synthetase (AMP-forming)/AMP-acid ligase II
MVVALVETANGSPLDEDALRAHSHATLAGYKVPKRFVRVDSLQRSPSGKADYKLLRGVAQEACS